MLDGANEYYGEVPGAPREPQYTGRFRVINQYGSVLQIGYNCYWYRLQGSLYVVSRETDRVLNSWFDPYNQIVIQKWPEQTRSDEWE